MMRRLMITACVFCGFAIAAGTASAATIYQYYSSFDLTGAYQNTSGGSIGVSDLSPALNTKISVTIPGGPAVPDVTQAAGPSGYSTTYLTGMKPGTTIAIRQPAASVAPTETYIVPSPTVDLAVGSSVITGSIPAGMSGSFSGDYRCGLNNPPRSLGAGPFSIAYSKVMPGESVDVSAYDDSGNSVYVVNAAPGETPCVELNTYDSGPFYDPPGTPVEGTPYGFSVNNLRSSTAPSVRAVLRRGTTVLGDVSADAQSVSGGTTTKPQAGDIIDVYRPKTAPTPSYSIAIFDASVKFDPAADLVAVDGPAAAWIEARFCVPYSCDARNNRGATNTAAGRTLFNFAATDGRYIAGDLFADSFVAVDMTNAEHTMSLRLLGVPGDLVAPVQSFKLPSKLKISTLAKALKKGYKLKLKSNEAGTAKLSLGKLATFSGPVKAGSNTIKFKFTKSGKKTIKKLAAKGKKAKPLTVTITSVVTDASGNASTFAKTTKLKR